MMLKKIALTACLLTTALTPSAALAYLTPEEVLLYNDLYLPPSPGGDAAARVAQQQEESRLRREQAQSGFVSSPAPEPTLAPDPTDPLHGSAPELEGLDAFDLELIRTIRLLDRLDSRGSLSWGEETLYSGAPLDELAGKGEDLTGKGKGPLAPTGAGGIITALTMIGAVGVTMMKAGRMKFTN